MSELRKFLFEGLPVRGMLVRLTESWQDLLKRRAQAESGAYPEPVRNLLGEMAAAGVLMQSNIKFNGALILQMQGDGPVRLAVTEVQPDLSFRATATVQAAVPNGARLVFLLHDIEGFTHEEIGTQLGITSGGSKAQLHRARMLLRAALTR